jgi:uncharacterized membrane protein required for colicin V production
VNLLDAICLLLIIGFSFWGLIRGFVREAFSLGGIILGVFLGLSLNSDFGAILTPLLGVDSDIGQILAFVIIFLLVSLLVSWLGLLVKKAVKFVLLGWLDRLLGLAFGFVKGVLIASVVCFLLVALPIPDMDKNVEGSKVGPLVIGVAPATYNTFFGGGEDFDLRGIMRRYLDEGEKSVPKSEPAPPSEEPVKKTKSHSGKINPGAPE